MAWNAEGQKICIVYEDGKYMNLVHYTSIIISETYYINVVYIFSAIYQLMHEYFGIRVIL